MPSNSQAQIFTLMNIIKRYFVHLKIYLIILYLDQLQSELLLAAKKCSEII